MILLISDCITADIIQIVAIQSEFEKQNRTAVEYKPCPRLFTAYNMRILESLHDRRTKLLVTTHRIASKTGIKRS